MFVEGLSTIRAMYDMEVDVNSFDGHLILLINIFLFRSAQFGIGKKGFMVSGTQEKWSDFLEDNTENYPYSADQPIQDVLAHSG